MAEPDIPWRRGEKGGLTKPTGVTCRGQRDSAMRWGKGDTHHHREVEERDVFEKGHSSLC